MPKYTSPWPCLLSMATMEITASLSSAVDFLSSIVSDSLCTISPHFFLRQYFRNINLADDLIMRRFPAQNTSLKHLHTPLLSLHSGALPPKATTFRFQTLFRFSWDPRIVS